MSAVTEPKPAARKPDAPASPRGRPIRGPSAFGGTTKRFLSLTYTLAITDFKLRFFGSALGYLWQLVRPLMLFAVLYAVFTRVLKVGVAVPFYPAILITNIVLFTFWAEVTAGSVRSIVDREGLMRKIQFPRLVIPLSITLTGLFNLALNLLAVAVFLAVAGVSFHPTIWEAPFLVLALGLFAGGTAMILSALYVRFRDVQPIWDVFNQALYFATPIIYSFETIKDRTHLLHVIMANPISIILTQFRHAVIDPRAANAVTAAGGWLWLLIPIAIWIFVIAFGVWFFDRQAPVIAEDL